MEQERTEEYQGLVIQKAAAVSYALEQELARLKKAWERLGKTGSGDLVNEMAKVHIESLYATLRAVFSATSDFLVKYDLELDYAFKIQVTKVLDDHFYPLADRIEERIRSDAAEVGDVPYGKGEFSSLRRDIEKAKVWYNNRIITFAFEMANRAGKAQ